MRFLKRAGVLRLYENMKQDFPIIDGEINVGKIDLILEKPYLTLFGSDEKYNSIYDKAACILEGFCRGHAFPDGNKRTALLATFAFLQANKHYLVVPLNTVEFLVKVAQNSSKTEKEIDELIKEIAIWLQQRTATNNDEFIQIHKKYMKKPLKKLILISFTGIGLLYARYLLNKWFATKFHPEYKQDFGKIINFLLTTLSDTTKAIKDVK